MPHDVAKALSAKAMDWVLPPAYLWGLPLDIGPLPWLARHGVGRGARRHKREVSAVVVVGGLVERPQLRLEESPPLACVSVFGEGRMDGDAISRLATLLHVHKMTRAEAIGGQRRDVQPVWPLDNRAVVRVRHYRVEVASDQAVEGALVVRIGVSQRQRLERPLGGEVDGGGIGCKPQDAGVEDSAAGIAGCVAAHDRGGGAMALVSIREHVEAVGGGGEGSALCEEAEEESGRVAYPRDVRIGDQRVAARLEHVDNQLRL